MRRILHATFAALTIGTSLMVHADDYPSRTIRWIVPYLAGTAPDMSVRIVAEALGENLKQSIIIENKPGAAGTLGARVAARAAPDGYTWMYASSPMATSMRMYRNPGFDVMKEFTHIGRIGTSELTVATNPSSGITNMGELIQRARSKPGGLMFASGGVGSPATWARN